MARYFIDLFTVETWEEFQQAGGEVSGFRSSKVARGLRPGDVLLAYLTGLSRFVAVLGAVTDPYNDDSPIWSSDVYPHRVKVRQLTTLTPETGVPISELRGVLSFMKDADRPNAWVGYVRQSPRQVSDADGRAIVSAVEAASADPVLRPVPKRGRPDRRPGVTSSVGTIASVADSDVEVEETEGLSTGEQTLEVQYLLLKLGSDMGLDVFVARNDRGKSWEGHAFAEVPRAKPKLKLNLDAETAKRVELIDVLWLQGNTIVKAFEVEHTTSIYSGILRMADLLALQPNLNIPLYIVAPDEREAKVVEEVNRPTFQLLPQPLSEVCRFIPFSSLKARVAEAKAYVKFMKPDFIDDIAISCELPEE
jgi:hypothetical protein